MHAAMPRSPLELNRRIPHSALLPATGLAAEVRAARQVPWKHQEFTSLRALPTSIKTAYGLLAQCDP